MVGSGISYTDNIVSTESSWLEHVGGVWTISVSKLRIYNEIDILVFINI